jgi:recombination protein RecA
VEYQKRFPNKVVLYIDVENAFDPLYGESLGLDYSRDKWLFSQPTCGEEAFEIADHFLKSGETSLIVFDSVAVLIPRAELEGNFGESKMGLQARLMSQALRKMVNSINKSGCTAMFINQLRENIGVMYGDSKVTTGGNALKFYASQRLDCSRIGQVKDGEEVTANKTRVRIKKNKVAAPFRVAEFDIVFGEGIDSIGEIVSLSSDHGIIKKSGSWYSYGDSKLGQGVENVKDALKKEPELLKEIEAKLRLNLGL